MSASNAGYTSVPLQSLNPVSTTDNTVKAPRYVTARLPDNKSDDYVRLEWKPPSILPPGVGIKGYLVTGLPYTLGNCIPKTLYCDVPPRTDFAKFQVRAISTNNEIGEAASVSIVEGDMKGLGGISVSVGNGSATINIVSNPPKEYDTYYYLVSTPQGPQTCRIEKSASSCSITGLTNGKSYQFKVELMVRISSGEYMWYNSIGPSLPVVPQGPVASTTKLSIVAGNQQLIGINSISAVPLTVLVTDSEGAPLTGAPVSFSSSPYATVLGGGGTTDNLGRVTLYVQANDQVRPIIKSQHQRPVLQALLRSL